MSERKIVCVPEQEIDEQKEVMRKIANINEGKIKRYHLSTFGCQLNENDSEKLSGLLSGMGYEESSDIQNSDIIIFNTCCVRENAEKKVYGRLGSLKKLKEQKGDNVIIAVCGCMMQREEIVNRIKKTYRHVDIIFGTHNIHKFPELLHRKFENKHTVIDVMDSDGSIAEGLPVQRKDSVKAWVTIMYGCNNFCSYCIVPYVRGRERSRDINDIVNEVKMLAQHDYEEITLLGQNVNSYGNDLPGSINFPVLLRELNNIEGISRIRFMTSHPKDLSHELIKVMSECEKISPHLHLPIQSGSTRILKLMNRKYTKEQYLGLIEMIREKIPNIALTTDIIVGFPGEQDEDFADTIDVIKKVRYDSAYTFLYSKRSGTPAAESADQVPEEVKKVRFDRLLELQNSISREINEQYKDKECEVLVEGVSKSNPDMLTGRTGTNKIVNFEGPANLKGKLIKVKIIDAKTWHLEGKMQN